MSITLFDVTEPHTDRHRAKITNICRIIIILFNTKPGLLIANE